MDNSFLKLMSTQKDMAELYSHALKIAGINAFVGKITPPYLSTILGSGLFSSYITGPLAKKNAEMTAVQGLSSIIQKGIFPFQNDLKQITSGLNDSKNAQKAALTLMQTSLIQSAAAAATLFLPDITANYKAQTYLSSITGLTASIFKHPPKNIDSGWLNTVDKVTAEASEVLAGTRLNDSHEIGEKLDELKDVFTTELRRLGDQLAKPGSTKVDRGSLIVAIIALLIATLSFYYQVTDIRSSSEIPNVQVQQVRDSLIADYKKVVEASGRRAVVIQKAALYIKPKSKAHCIGSLHPGKEVIIINVLHKWANISFISSEDQLPTTAWVQKKYLQTIQ